ncbi:MAG: ABC transporter permease [Tepidanaerobacteraceae bacterium]|jgi:simple sugar transport system permease protein|nr:ABC transporter permease [Tepidanaerobacteraceae bacterium]
MDNLFNIIFSTNFGYAVLRVTTPILFAALAALISDRAGVINISLEGTMLAAALTGVIFSAYTGSAWVGLLFAVIAGIFMSSILAYFSLYLKTDIILGGIALNLMASGGTVFVLYLVAHDKGISASLASKVLPQIELPLISKIPVIGPVLSNHNVMTYFSLIAVIVVYYFLYRTPLGLRIRAVGENPDAADSVGISVRQIQFVSLIASGILAGFGGAYMSMGYVSWFSRDMTAGRGFIALAAEAMGMATPIGTFLASLLFGFADALSNSLQSLRIPAEFVQMIPYITTIIGLAIYASRRTQRAGAKTVRKEVKA